MGWSALGTLWRHWPWAASLTWGAALTVALGWPWWMQPEADPGRLVAVISNGLTVFLLVGGVGAVGGARQSGAWRGPAWPLALAMAGATVALLLPVRLAALALDVAGPWRGPVETALDIAARAAVVFVLTGWVGRWQR
jgi:hypothetical protein